jgi:hypothetical protein
MMEASALFDDFERAVHRELEPVLDAHGYRLERSDREREFMLFTSDRAFVAVGFVPGSDPGVPYVDLRIGPLAAAGKPSSGFDLPQILRHYEPGLSRPEVNQRVGRVFFRATTTEETTGAVGRLREWVERLSDVLGGDPELFQAIDDERHARLKRRVMEQRLDDVRALVDTAWLARDWDRVAELLRTVPSEERSRADAKRLEIAERRVQG